MIAESRFIRLSTSFAKFFLSLFESSKTIGYLVKFSNFLEESFRGSLIYSLFRRVPNFYPERAWGIFDSLNDKLKGGVEIFNPVFIFPFVFFAFVCISSYRASNLAIFSIFVGVCFFVFGILLSRRIEFSKIYLEEYRERAAVLLLTISTLALIYDLFQAGSVPLISPTAKRHLSVTYTMLASLMVPGAILTISSLGEQMRAGTLSKQEARMYAVAALLSTMFLISLLGYRTQTIVSLLGCSIAMYYLGIVGVSEILLAFFVAVLSISAIGYYGALSKGSAIGFGEVIGRRLGLTLSVYDYLIERFWLFGANHGYTALATFSSYFHFLPGPRLGPRTIVARVYEVEGISMTSTLFGTVVLDFGIPGVAAFALILGVIIGMAYFAMKRTKSAFATSIFSFLLAYSLVGIETGLVDFNVFMFFLVGVSILTNSRK